MVDPLVRQTALEIILSRKGTITPQELQKALELGLADPDLSVFEMAWNFVNENRLIKDYKKNLINLAMRLGKDEDEYCRQLANQILAAIEKVSVIKA